MTSISTTLNIQAHTTIKVMNVIIIEQTCFTTSFSLIRKLLSISTKEKISITLSRVPNNIFTRSFFKDTLFGNKFNNLV